MHPRLRKSLGQHHLIDSALCRPLLDYLAPAGRRVVEIGPGGGKLTTPLLDAGASVWAVELDLSWAAHVRPLLGGRGRWGLVVADALELAWERLPPGTLVTGNLPYNVATVLLARLLPHHASVERAAFLVQKEVAERLTARPGDDAWGSLSVLAHAYCRARVLGRVKPGSFRPPPKVESAFVGLELVPPPLPAAEMPAFLHWVQAAFGQRRKTLRNSLGTALGREVANAALAASGLDPGERIERLGLPELLRLEAARHG
jgi:16S rRNA (adenine1518-N6/adenine1519-N6)-dimethyltransferase